MVEEAKIFLYYLYSEADIGHYSVIHPLQRILSKSNQPESVIHSGTLSLPYACTFRPGLI